MRITEHVHAIRISFQIRVGPDKVLDRFAYAYWIDGAKICLVDAGVAGSGETILDTIREVGRGPRDVAWLILTHAHPDHIGGAREIREATGCSVAAHHDDAPWIWDVDRQARERPVPGFHRLVEGSVVVDRLVGDDETFSLSDSATLTVLHTPGHSKGHIALYYEPDAALFTGDAIPVAGQIPIYDDPVESVRSMRRLRDLDREGMNVEVLLSSWDEPRRGDAIGAVIDAGIEYVLRVHGVVLKEKAAAPDADIRSLTTRVLRSLGLPELLANPLLFRAMEAHVRAGENSELRTDSHEVH